MVVVLKATEKVIKKLRNNSIEVLEFKRLMKAEKVSKTKSTTTTANRKYDPKHQAFYYANNALVTHILTHTHF